MFKYFRGALWVTVIGLTLAGVIGGTAGLWAAFNLALLETSLSFDNAVVNASILRHWDPLWRKRFLIWGMLIAVFGMRVLFPLVIVAVIAHAPPLPGPFSLWDWYQSGQWPARDVLSMAIVAPKRYADTLQSAHIEVMAFGGTFLLQVFWHFFLNQNKESHWLRPLERAMQKLGRLEMAGAVMTLLGLLVLADTLPDAEGFRLLIAGVWGLIAYIVVNGLSALMGQEGGAVQMGWAGFLYLEVLDASFSFDGVLGAFALTRNIFLIAIGLGIGAMFVRSFTLMLVEKGTLSELRYLEHGAFWAIGALATIMLLAPVVEVPDAATGGIAAVLIVLAALHSWQANRSDRQRGIGPTGSDQQDQA
ncbi:DUF475 domain-containing protein [Silvimonas sp. JCM 19000]